MPLAARKMAARCAIGVLCGVFVVLLGVGMMRFLEENRQLRVSAECEQELSDVRARASTGKIGEAQALLQRAASLCKSHGLSSTAAYYQTTVDINKQVRRIEREKGWKWGPIAPSRSAEPRNGP